jgi:hypothetical protein
MTVSQIPVSLVFVELIVSALLVAERKKLERAPVVPLSDVSGGMRHRRRGPATRGT